MRRFCLNKFILLVSVFFITLSFGIHFPTEQEFLKEYAVAAREKGRPILYVSRKKKPRTEVELIWDKTIVVQVTFKQTISFTDHQLSRLSLMFGRGGNWIETPLEARHKLALQNAFSGIEQQWILNGYGKETGWMGSGLVYKKYFITFRRKSPIGPPQTSKPLQVRDDVKERFKKSGTWLKTKCKSGQKDKICFSSILNSNISIMVDPDYNVIDAWIKENSSLVEIQNTISSLTRDKYSEYSRDLEEMSKLEGQSSILKIASEIPEIFNWTSYQIQSKRIGFIKSARYMSIFARDQGKWPYIPVFEYSNKKCTVTINLHFNGHYHLKVARLGG